MLRGTRKWAVGTAALVVPIGLLAVTVLAQQRSEPADMTRAKQIVAMIQGGQLNLRTATELAENHTKGIALEARCDVTPGSAEGQGTNPGMPPEKQPQAEKERASQQRLIYHVSCFANDKLQVVRVDGFTKKVLDGGTGK